AVRIAFENVDDRLRLEIDGREVLRLDFESGSPPVERNQLRIEAEDLQAELRSIRIYRDVYYCWYSGFRYAQSSPIELKEGEYFALGDNSPSSSDGRHWGPVPAQNMLGKAFLVFWPALPWRWEVKLIR
ncbi:MAG: S26 family signal peptidase, partial [Planctomycetes bacterium]|nr:S26 family signal peptidase [Planctomycetota bacterium]